MKLNLMLFYEFLVLVFIYLAGSAQPALHIIGAVSYDLLEPFGVSRAGLQSAFSEAHFAGGAWCCCRR